MQELLCALQCVAQMRVQQSLETLRAQRAQLLSLRKPGDAALDMHDADKRDAGAADSGRKRASYAERDRCVKLHLQIITIMVCDDADWRTRSCQSGHAKLNEHCSLTEFLHDADEIIASLHFGTISFDRSEEFDYLSACIRKRLRLPLSFCTILQCKGTFQH